ncbi:hypothetical protein [Carboxydothermus pertinax]|uniref:Viral A-type inclusion protein n=1 Tax=Carboxydothermus pertinax TaxID=870242 RepID=A0A1L8CUA7_9THEO|nr:hypothetical protein [Carboxydothermus pertinax]GAV22515.1 hypothetical protein cpu_10250 [Carboxydothermus pertinax]
MNFEEKLNQLKKGIDAALNHKNRAEALLMHVQEQEKELLRQIAELGVEPDKLEEEIKRLEEELTRQIAAMEREIPWDLIEKLEAKTK